MWKSVLALSALVAFVVEGRLRSSSGGVGEIMQNKENLPPKLAAIDEVKVYEATPTPTRTPYDGEMVFEGIDLYEFSGNRDDFQALPLLQREDSTFNLRPFDTISIVDREKAGLKEASPDWSEKTLAEGFDTKTIVAKLIQGDRVYVFKERSQKETKKGSKPKMKPDGKPDLKENDFGFIMVAKGFGPVRFRTKAAYKNEKPPAKKPESAAVARYADDGDYYGYAGEYYNDYDDEQDIDASRLIEYAYNMGLRAGSRKASQRKRRYDYYYR